ncbi:MAG: hypothetical protein ACFFAN_04335 [Promethearchaeota archaeon]
MEELELEGRIKICQKCGKEINETELSKVFKFTYGIMKNNIFSEKKVRYYHVECLAN